MVHKMSNQPKILIVDDMAENLMALEKLLHKVDAEIIKARSGNEALAFTLEHSLALIILDVQMPDMNGFEVAEILKWEERTADIPIIFLTALDRSEHREVKGYDKGAVDFVFKPFNEHILLSKVKIFLDIYNTKNNLEQMVLQRTQELSLANKELRRSIKEEQVLSNELQETKNYLNTIIESIPTMLLATDQNGLLRLWNRAIEDFTGISRTQAMGKNLAEIYPDLAGYLDQATQGTEHSNESGLNKKSIKQDNSIWEKVSSSQVWKGQISCTDFKGRSCELETIVAPIFGSQAEEIIGFVSVSRDITQMLEMKKELHQTQKMEALGRLAGGVAHDFNNILAAIGGFSEQALLGIAEDSKSAKNLKKSLEATNRAKNLVKQILAFSRKTEHDKKPVKICSIISEVLDLIRASLPSTIEIRSYLPEEEVIVSADSVQMHQVIMNLCTNAADAMNSCQGGLLEIVFNELELMEQQGKESALDLEPGSYIRLDIRDTGQGIEPQIIDKIFDPFFTTKAPDKGTGMGLSMVYGIVQNHGGTVTVQTEQNKGTVFHIYLPRMDIHEIRELEYDAQQVFEGREKILFVDDEPMLAELAEEMFEDMGYKVLTETDSSAALEAFKEDIQGIDLVITDFTMPGMTGLELAEKMLALRSDLPIILCSGLHESGTEAKARSLGIRHLVSKPFSRQEIAECMRKIFDQKLPQNYKQ